MASPSAGLGNSHTERENLSQSNGQPDFAKFGEDQPGDTLPFYEIEGKILALWDRLNELKLEVAIVETSSPQGSCPRPP